MGPQLMRWVRSSVLVVLPFFLLGCNETLYSRLSEQEANDMVLVLQMSGVAATKDRLDEKSWEVKVASNQMASALAALKEAGMPKATHTEIGDLFKKQGLVSSPFEQRVRYLHGVSQELSHTLSQIDGVVSARVHIVIPASHGDSTADQKATASIFIKHRKEVALDNQVIAIKQLVAHGVDGLDYENISLALFPTNVSSDGKLPQVVAGWLPSGSQIWVGGALIVAGLLISFVLGVGRGGRSTGGVFGRPRSRSPRGAEKQAPGA